MNLTPVDYSYVPMAFSNLSKNIDSAAGYIDKYQKQKEHEEQIKQLKASRKDVEEAREKTIVELATQYREAAGLPDNDAGYDRALSVVSSAIYPLTQKEMNNPDAAAIRINSFEMDQFPKLLNKAKMDRYRRETESVPRERVRPEGAAPMQQEEGQVGVEDEGVYRTMSAPKSVEEMQANVAEETLRAPYVMPMVGMEPTSKEMMGTARDIYGPDIPAPIQSEIGRTGRGELATGDYPEGFTREQAYGEVAKKPVVEKDKETFVKQFPETPKALSELDLAKIAKLRADAAKLRKTAEGGGEIKFSDLTKLQNQRNNVEKTIKDVTRTIADIDNKLRDPRKMDVEGGETAESLIQQRDGLNQQLESNRKQLPAIDNDIKVVRERLEVPEVESTETEAEAGPSPEAQKVATSIRKMMNQDNIKPSKKFKVVDRFGEQVYYDPKKKKYDSGSYRVTMAKQIVEYANERGLGMNPASDVPAMAEKLKTMSVEQIIERIISAKSSK